MRRASARAKPRQTNEIILQKMCSSFSVPWSFLYSNSRLLLDNISSIDQLNWQMCQKFLGRDFYFCTKGFLWWLHHCAIKIKTNEGWNWRANTDIEAANMGPSKFIRDKIKSNFGTGNETTDFIWTATLSQHLFVCSRRKIGETCPGAWKWFLASMFVHLCLLDSH